LRRSRPQRSRHLCSPAPLRAAMAFTTMGKPSHYPSTAWFVGTTRGSCGAVLRCGRRGQFRSPGRRRRRRRRRPMASRTRQWVQLKEGDLGGDQSSNGDPLLPYSFPSPALPMVKITWPRAPRARCLLRQWLRVQYRRAVRRGRIRAAAIWTSDACSRSESEEL
jgi:hypothetical protein